MHATALTDEALVSTLKQLVSRERYATADVLEHLAEVDARKLYVRFPASSMTGYCVAALAYSQDGAGKRVTTARLVRRFPQLVAMVRDGRLHLTALSVIGPHLAPENVDARAAEAVGKTKLQLEEVIARWAPKADVPNRITEVVPPVVTGMLSFAPAQTSSPSLSDALANTLRRGSLPAQPLADPQAQSQPQTLADPQVQSQPQTLAAPQVRPRPQPQPQTPTPVPEVATASAPTGSAALASALPSRAPKALSPGRYKLELTIDGETRDALMKTRDYLRHAIPDGDFAKIVARAVKDLLAKVEARKFGKRKRAKLHALATTTPNKPSARTITPPDKRGARTATTPNERGARAATTAAPPAPSTPRATALPRTGPALQTAAVLASAPRPNTHSSASSLQSPEQPTAATPASRPNQAPLPTNVIIEEDFILRRSPSCQTRRDVAERDGYQCTYVGDSGQRCSSTAWLEHDHVTAWCHNGTTNADNVRLMCRIHHRARHAGGFCTAALPRPGP